MEQTEIITTMSPTKTPTSSLSGSSDTHYSVFFLWLCLTTAVELLAKRVWHRSRARIKQLFSKAASPETPTACSSLVTKLPLEIVEIIIAHLIYDTDSLLACSLTCYSWYIASVPHLHHTLSVRPGSWSLPQKFGWPTPLQNASRLGLLPLVKRFWVHATLSCDDRFSSKRFNRRILSQFSAMTNVRDLRIDNMDIPSFMPRVRRYFGHFLPTVRSLALGSPGGSRRQIIFFIGLFKHLEDLTLFNSTLEFWESEPTNDPALIPPFTPPLR